MFLSRTLCVLTERYLDPTGPPTGRSLLCYVCRWVEVRWVGWRRDGWWTVSGLRLRRPEWSDSSRARKSIRGNVSSTGRKSCLSSGKTSTASVCVVVFVESTICEKTRAYCLSNPRYRSFVGGVNCRLSDRRPSFLHVRGTHFRPNQDPEGTSVVVFLEVLDPILAILPYMKFRSNK